MGDRTSVPHPTEGSASTEVPTTLAVDETESPAPASLRRRLPTLAILGGRGSEGDDRTARRPLSAVVQRVVQNAAYLGQIGRSLARIPGNPLELVPTGTRRSGRLWPLFLKPPGFAAQTRSPHTREVAGSNPAAPTEKTC
jgi:hypothetical protein